MDEAKVVERALLLILTTELDTKLVPLTVNVNPESPTFFELGDMETFVGPKLLTVNVCPFEVPPPGAELNTVIVEVPADTRSEVRIKAVS